MLLPPGRDGRKRVASGRGLTRDEARRNCAWEAAERTLAVFDAGCRVHVASLRQLSEDAIDPSGLILLSDRQYQRRAQWNDGVAEPHRWPKPFDRGNPIAWVKGRRHAGGGDVWVPAAAAYLGYDAAFDEGFTVPDSNGLAVGTSRDDAICRALLELIERDAAAIWWYNRLPRPALQFDPSELPVMNAINRWIGEAERNLWLLDLTADLAIPVAAAVCSNGRGSDLSIGFGAGRTQVEAAFAALGELVQFDVNKKMKGTPDEFSSPHFIALLARSTVDDMPFLRPDATARRRPARTWSGLAELCGHMSRANLAPIVVDFPAREIFAVRVIVPRLRPIWPRFAPGRLYEVPVTLGWRTEPTNEQELNPMPILY